MEAENIEKINESQSNNCSHFIKMPLCFQETEYTCGVACVQSTLAGYGIHYKQDVLSEILKTKPIYGTDYHNIVTFLKGLGFQATYSDDMDIPMVKELINRGIAPILLIQSWKSDEIDYLFVWQDSHYTIACGYDNNRIFFMDPYTLGYYTYLTHSELMKRWHVVDYSGNHIYHSGIIAANDNLPFIYDPHAIKHQE